MDTFNPTYQSVYNAGLTRIRQSAAGQRGAALRGAQRQGVLTSGVSQLPQDAIDAATVRSESDLGANVAQAQDAERLADKNFEQRKELMTLSSSLSEAAAARERKLANKANSANIKGQIIGAGIGLAGGIGAKYLANKYGWED